uniref:Uncharacterized protein n=1 Tax=Mastacembelus armatus TaxID=205130 RepID=A0A3Q3SKR7_9TELE
MFLSGVGLMDLIPRSCQFPPDVHHVIQMMNMENLQKSDMRTSLVNSDYGRSTSHRQTRPQIVLHKASGSRASGLIPQTARKSSAAADGMDRSVLFISNTLNAESINNGYPAKESLIAAPTPIQSPSCLNRPSLSSDLQVWSSWESNEGSEPQLSLQEEVFTFSSQPHSPKRGQGQGDQVKMEMGDDQVQSKNWTRYEVQLEDDFIGSESDESNASTPRTPKPTLNVQLGDHVESCNMAQTLKVLKKITTNMHSPSGDRTEPAGLVPTRCLSPTATPNRQEHKCCPRGSEAVLDGNSSVQITRQYLIYDLILKEEDERLKPVDTSHSALHLLENLRMHGDDDEELQMLASLKREQEEDECRASGLSASQIHHCNVSISMSSDDTSTWMHISMPANQGHHYQNEMNPLLHSNPREWMDILSPPIMPPSQQRRSGKDESVNEVEDEDEFLNLFYDHCLNCYFDPKTGKYYELA